MNKNSPTSSVAQQIGAHMSMIAIAGLLMGAIMPLLVPSRTVQAASVQLYLSSDVSSVEKGATFSVSVRMNAVGELINAVQADFTYPVGSVQFIGIGASSDFGVPAPSSGGAGSVSIGRGNASGIDGDRLVAVVAFKALADTGSGVLAFTGTSQALRSSDNTDALTGTAGLSFNFTAPPAAAATPAPTPPPAVKPTPAPVAKTPTPAPAVVQPTPAVPAPAPATPPATPVSQAPNVAISPEVTALENQPATAKPVDSSPVNGKLVVAGVTGLILLAAAVGGILVFRHRVRVTPLTAGAIIGSGSDSGIGSDSEKSDVSPAAGLEHMPPEAADDQSRSEPPAPRPPLIQG